MASNLDFKLLIQAINEPDAYRAIKLAANAISSPKVDAQFSLHCTKHYSALFLADKPELSELLNRAKAGQTVSEEEWAAWDDKYCLPIPMKVYYSAQETRRPLVEYKTYLLELIYEEFGLSESSIKLLYGK